MKKLTIAILLAMLATPAKALDRSDAKYIGEKFGEKVCQAVWDGASTQDEALEKSIDNLSPSALQDLKSVLDIVEEHGEDHEVSEAYLEGYAEGVYPCWKAYSNLP